MLCCLLTGMKPVPTCVINGEMCFVKLDVLLFADGHEARPYYKNNQLVANFFFKRRS